MQAPQQSEPLKPKCRDMHKVERKETVYSICRMYGITEEELLAANPEIVNKKLKKGKRYYFKVRAYRTVNGKKVYSSYSAVKSVRVK